MDFELAKSVAVVLRDYRNYIHPEKDGATELHSLKTMP